MSRGIPAIILADSRHYSGGFPSCGMPAWRVSRVRHAADLSSAKRLGQPFVQAEPTIAQLYGGNGLGWRCAGSALGVGSSSATMLGIDLQ